MAEIVNIKVQTTGASKVANELQIIRNHVDYLNKTPVNVKVDSSGIHKGTSGIKQYATETKKAKEETNLLGDSLDNIAAKMLAWQVMGTAIASVLRSFREAVTTMRAVDHQLTNIAKVSDLTAREIQKIGESAYNTASKYGVAADKYLEAVY